MDVTLDFLRTTLLQIDENKNITQQQRDCITQWLDDVARYGNDDQKKTACRYMCITRTNLPFNSVAINILTEQEKSFRLSCAPLLNSLSAFLPIEYGPDSDPEDSPAGSPVPF